MKKLLLALAALSSVAMADNKFFGLGLAGGLGTDGNLGALHGRLWVQNPNAVDISAAWNSNTFSLLGEYKWFQYKDIQIQNGQLPWYYGLGGFLVTQGSGSDIGARTSLGLSWEPSGIPLDFFGELGASVSLKNGVSGDSRIGFHWYWM